MTTDKFTDVRVGVIGVGVMGHDHVTRITERIKGARVTAVYDFMADTAEKVAAEAGAEVFPSWEEVVVSDQVDAVLIASRVSSTQSRPSPASKPASRCCAKSLWR